jgi:hypothetical protein
MSNHYVYLMPGEKIFVLTNQEAGVHDHETTVVELEFRTKEYDGEPYFQPAKQLGDTDQSVTAYRYEMLDQNEQANLTFMTLPGGKDDTLDHAYAIENEKRMKTGQTPFVSVPIKR